MASKSDAEEARHIIHEMLRFRELYETKVFKIECYRHAMFNCRKSATGTLKTLQYNFYWKPIKVDNEYKWECSICHMARM